MDENGQGVTGKQRERWVEHEVIVILVELKEVDYQMRAFVSAYFRTRKYDPVLTCAYCYFLSIFGYQELTRLALV